MALRPTRFEESAAVGPRHAHELYGRRVSRAVFRSFILALLFSFGVAYSQPKITIVEGTKFDLGIIDEGETVTRKLTLRNTGNDTLVISNVSTSCGCTVAELPTKRVAPGETSLLTIIFYTKDVVGSRVRRQVFVRSNDSTQSSVTITLVAAIKKMIEAEPRYINFAIVKLGSVVTRTVVLKNMCDTTLKFLTVTVPDTQLTARLADRVVKPLGQTELMVSLKPRKAGKLAGQVEITIGGRREQKISISYVAGVKR